MVRVVVGLLLVTQICAMEKEQDMALPTDHYRQEISRLFEGPSEFSKAFICKWLETLCVVPDRDKIKTIKFMQECDIPISLCWGIGYKWEREKGASLVLHPEYAEDAITIDLKDHTFFTSKCVSLLEAYKELLEILIEDDFINNEQIEQKSKEVIVKKAEQEVHKIMLDYLEYKE